MPTITITGDTEHQALQNLINQGIDRYGKEFVVQISENLRFEEQNEEIRKAIRQFVEDISVNPYPKDVFVPNVRNDAIRRLWGNWNKSAIEKLKEVFSELSYNSRLFQLKLKIGGSNE